VESLANEPHFISQLTRVACHEQIVDELRALLPGAVWSDDELAAIQADLRSLNFDEGLKRSMYGERVQALQFFLDPDGDEERGAMQLFWWVYGGSNTVHFLETYANPFVDCAGMPWPEKWTAIDELASDTETAFDGRDRSTSIAATMSALSAPALRIGFAAIGHAQATVYAAAVAIAVERHRLRHGQLPESLVELETDLLPAVPIDSFDGKPLQYERTDEGYRVYGTLFARPPAEVGGASGGLRDVEYRVELLSPTREPAEASSERS